jgi:hypothetical protein
MNRGGWYEEITGGAVPSAARVAGPGSQRGQRHPQQRHEPQAGSGLRTGQFEDETTDQKIHVNAKSGPEGQGARGWIWETTTTATEEISYKANVTCLSVNGNKAVIGGEIIRSKTGETGFVVVYIEDDGEPGKGNDRVERLVSATAPTCEEEFPVAKTITKGNYIIHDATTDSR